METKEQIRRRLLAARDRLAEAEVKRMSALIAGHFLRSGLIDRAETIALYASIRNEVRTEEIFSGVKRAGKQVFFPRILGSLVEFLEVERWADLGPGKWGVPEPRSGVPGVLEKIELVVVPGVAFDEGGCRIGFGKGYFDKALSGYRGIKVGLAYDFQVLTEIPGEERDLRCDHIFTESRTIPANDSRRG